MSSNADSLVRDAISAYRAGKKEEARNLLLQAVGLDERHEQGWLWLSAVVDTPEDQITCLENVLTINPNNEKAKQGIQLLSSQITGSKPSAPSSFQSEPDLEDEDPFANVSFTSTPQPSTPPAVQADDDEELPDTSSWGTIETSSASAQRPKKELTPDDYNDWISGLNIGSNEAPEAFGLIEEDADDDVFNASPFIGADDDDDDEMPFELDRNVFGFEEDDEAGGKMSAGPFSASPFSADIDDDEPPAKPAPPATTVPVTLAPRPAAAAPQRSPISREDDLLDDFDGDDNFDDFDDGDYDQADLGTVDPAHFFTFIPDDIKPTRLPGTNERYPALVMVGLLLLVVFNGGALALVWMTLTSVS
jgi:hypothetical protein